MSTTPLGPSADSPADALAGAETERSSARPPRPAAQSKLLAIWAAITALAATVLGAARRKMAARKTKGAEDAAPGEKRTKPWYLRAATISAVIFLVLIVSLYIWVKIPPGVTAYSDPVSAESRDRNTHAAAALGAGFIEDPLVDIDQERAYVAYNLPQVPDGTATLDTNDTVSDIDTDPDLMQRFVLGTLAAVAPDVERVVAVQYIDHRPSWMWNMQMADFKAFMNGDITIDELDERIERNHL